ncbi:glutathione synthetase [Vairimorpha apis BRL 01]|uniref:Glutathione synthetase n=1 Tax=Vairimorpha apis BRL 01 TaxID=1037528 RepID=T0MCK0_9MICR|nr:glutathione synthetase [Vairimorpha apis BRL 01]
MDNKELLRHLGYANGLYNSKTGKLINFTVQPSFTSKKSFLKLCELQKKLNLLYFNLSKNLDEFIFPDPFYQFLYSVYKEKNKKKENICTFLIRSDYLLDENSQIHSLLYKNTEISENENTTPNTTNYVEKTLIIDLLLKDNINIVYCKITDLRIDNGSVYIRDKHVCIVYYRWFYNLEQFDSNSKQIFFELEISNVISLPSVEFRMINNKFFQVELAKKDVLKKYTTDYEELSDYFTEFKTTDAFNLEKYDQSNWVFKTVLEGGNSINLKNSEGFFMKKIISPTVDNAFIYENKMKKMINEISTFGSFIAINNKIIHNDKDGYLVMVVLIL